MEHLERAKKERDYYRSICDETKSFYKSNAISAQNPKAPNSLKGTIHYSFDYAQQVSTCSIQHTKIIKLITLK